MKNTLLFISLHLVCFYTKAQIVTFSPKEFFQSVQNAMIEKKQLLIQTKTYSETMNILSTAQKTTFSLQKIIQMEEKIKRELKQLKSLKGLKWNNINDLFSINHYLGDNLKEYLKAPIDQNKEIKSQMNISNQGEQLINHLEKGEKPEDAKLFQQFLLPNQALTIEQHLEEKIQKSQRAYHVKQLAQSQKLHLAMIYKHIADSLTTKSKQMNTKLLQEGNGAIELTEGERITSQAEVQRVMLKAVEYREKSIQMLEEATNMGEDPISRHKNSRFASREIFDGLKDLLH